MFGIGDYLINDAKKKKKNYFTIFIQVSNVTNSYWFLSKLIININNL